MPVKPLFDVVGDVLTYGAKKYGKPLGKRQILAWSRPYAAALRTFVCVVEW